MHSQANRIPLWSAPALVLILCSSVLWASPSALQPYGRCAAPAQQGVNICMPYQGAQVKAPFQLIAAATSGRGQVDHIELWADGAKLMQTRGAPFDAPVSLPLGDHTLTVIEVDDTGFYSKSSPLNVTVAQVASASDDCSPPSSAGVNVCEPAPNSCNTQPWIDVSAAATGSAGPVVRMEVWLNGAKVANFPGDHFETSMIFFDAFYTLEIWEIDSHGNALKKDLFLDGPC
jgi:hypothetical protein